VFILEITVPRIEGGKVSADGLWGWKYESGNMKKEENLKRKRRRRKGKEKIKLQRVK
jgi:hypothetical protein